MRFLIFLLLLLVHGYSYSGETVGPYPDWLFKIYKDTTSNCGTPNSCIFNGEYLRFTVHENDPLVGNHHRAELSHFYSPTWGAERVYDGCFNIPDFSRFFGNLDMNIMQWHQKPDLGDVRNGPPLLVVVKNKELFIFQRTDLNRITTETIKPVTLYSAPIDSNKWYCIKVDIKWSNGPPVLGKLKIFLNKVNIVDKSGINSFNDEFGPYWKFGIYSPTLGNGTDDAGTYQIIKWKNLRFYKDTAN